LEADVEWLKRLKDPTQKDGASLAGGWELRALVVSRDTPTIKSLSRLFEESVIQIELRPNEESAIQELCRNKYEAIVLDFKSVRDGLGLLRKQRAMTSNGTAVTWGIVNSDRQIARAVEAGANFAIARPLSETCFVRMLKASYPLMLREKRRYYRTPMRAQVLVRNSSYPEFIANSLNISEGGIALEGAVPVEVGEKLDLRFRLPGVEEMTSLTADVCWFDRDGRVGLHFVTISQRMKEQIQRWIREPLNADIMISIE
jgi:CheY-like chemotaxis protein